MSLELTRVASRGTKRGRDGVETQTRRRHRAASVEDINGLWRAYSKRRCQDARERLIVHYSPLVHFVAARVGAGVPRSLEHGDLVSFGAIGLIEAVDRFDPSRNVKFETYAVTRIRGAMLDEMRALDWVPRSVRSEVRRVERSKAKLRADLLREPTQSEVAGDLGSDGDDVRDVRITSLVALEELVALGGGEDGDHVTVLDTIEDDSSEELGAAVETGEIRAALLDSMAELGEREYKIISLYYFQGFTLSRIGKLFGVTESRVSQIHAKALRKLGRSEGLRACGESCGWTIATDDSGTVGAGEVDDRQIA